MYPFDHTLWVLVTNGNCRARQSYRSRPAGASAANKILASDRRLIDLLIRRRNSGQEDCPTAVIADVDGRICGVEFAEH